MVTAATIANVFLSTAFAATTAGVIVAGIGAIIVNLAISAILGKILAPDVPGSARDTKGLQTIISSNIAPRRVCYGEAITGGPYILVETIGTTNEIFNMAIALCGHPIEDVVGVFINDQYVYIEGSGGTTNDSGNDLDANYYVNTGKYGTGDAVGHVRIIKNLGWGYADFDHVTSATATKCSDDRERTDLINSAVTTNWTPPSPNSDAARDSGTGLYSIGYKATNCSYIFLSFKFNRDVWSGFPKVKFHIKGKNVYNPADDTTQPGGSGAQRLNNPDTWTWSDNWGACNLDYLLNTSYGLGAKTSGDLVEIDWDEAVIACNDSDDLVTNGYPSPFTQNEVRYTLNGIFEVSATPISNMEALISSGAGMLVYSQGTYKLRAGKYRAPENSTDIINEDMIVSALTLRTHTPRGDLFNKVAGVYVEAGFDRSIQPSESNKPIFEPSDFPIIDPLDSGGANPFEVIDEEEIIKEIDFPYCINEFEAQRLARIQLERIRQGLTVQFEADLEVLKYSVGDNVYLEILSDSKYSSEVFYNRLGLDDVVQNRPDSPGTPYYKQFKILDMEYTENFTIAVTMVEESEEIYDWNAGDANKVDYVLESALITDDPDGTILAPSWLVDSPFTAITEEISSEAATLVYTLIRWQSPERGSLQVLDRVNIDSYRVEYGTVTDPSLTPENRVTSWIHAGTVPNDHDDLVQGPLSLPTLYRDGTTDYDFRVLGTTHGGRSSDWAYYSVDTGSDYSPGPPTAISNDAFYILPTQGTAIKNGVGDLIVEAHHIVSGIDTLLSTGTVQLFDPSNNVVNTANSYQSGSDGYTGVLDSTNINNEIVITMKDGISGQPLDTISLVDIIDGGLAGYIEPENGLAWRRVGASGDWEPAQLTTDLDCTFVDQGVDIARQGYRLTLNSDDGTITGATTAHPLGDLNTGNITIITAGSGTGTFTVTFEHNSPSFATVTETVVAVAGGASGSPGQTTILNYDDLDTTQLAAGSGRYVLSNTYSDDTQGSQNNFHLTETILINNADVDGKLWGLFYSIIEVGDIVTYYISNTRWFQFTVTETFDTVGAGAAEAYKFAVTILDYEDPAPTTNQPTTSGNAVQFWFNTGPTDDGNLLADPDFDFSDTLPSFFDADFDNPTFFNKNTHWVARKHFVGASTSPITWGITFLSAGGANNSNAIKFTNAKSSGPPGPGPATADLVARRRIRTNTPSFDIKLRLRNTDTTSPHTEFPFGVEMVGFSTPISTTEIISISEPIQLDYNDGTTWDEVEIHLEGVGDPDAQYWEFRIAQSQPTGFVSTMELDSVFVYPTARSFGSNTYIEQDSGAGSGVYHPGLVPKSDTANDSGKVLQADGTWVTNTGSGLADGTVNNSVIRWDGITPIDWVEEPQVQISDTGVFSVLDATLADSAAFSHDGTDFSTVFTTTTDWDITGLTGLNIGASIATVNVAANATSSLYIGEQTTLRGAVQAGHLRLYGEAGSLIYGAQISVGGSTMLVAGVGGNLVDTAQITMDVDVMSGKHLLVANSGNTDSLTITHDGTDVKLTTVNTTNLDVVDANLQVLGGGNIRVYDSGGADSIALSDNGTQSLIDATANPIYITSGGGEVHFRTGIDVHIWDSVNTNSVEFNVTTAVNIVASVPGGMNITGITNLTAVNYNLDVDQTVGAGQDNYVLTYDNGDGQISLEAAVSGTPVDITVADESADTTCFPAFFTAATGDLGPKTGTNLTFNSSSGDLVATLIAGIANANLVDKAAAENISGQWELQDNVKLAFGNSADIQLDYDSTGNRFDINLGTTADFSIRGGTGGTEILFSAAADGGVSQYWNNNQETITALHSTTGNLSGLSVKSHDGSFRFAGFNDLKVFNDNVSDTLEAAHSGAVAFKDATTARTLTLEASGSLDFPVSAMTTVINAFTSTDYTITEGATTTLYYLDGSTRVDTAGGCTVGPGGVANIWREAAAVYYIWGTGITA